MAAHLSHHRLSFRPNTGSPMLTPHSHNTVRSGLTTLLVVGIWLHPRRVKVIRQLIVAGMAV